MSALLLALIALPAAAGTLLCLVGHRADRFAAVAGVGVAVVVLGGSAALAGAPGVGLEVPFLPTVPGGGVGLAVDPLTGLLLPVVAAVTVLVLGFTAAQGTEAAARFHGLMLLFLAAVLTTLCATTLVTVLFAWELMGAVSWALIGFRWRQGHRVGAGLSAFVTTRTADLGLYLAAGAALAGGGSLTLADLPALPAGWRDLVAAGLLVAALGKAAQLPFSAWLSRAMEGPSTVSALLHSAAMVAMGGYLLLRMQPVLATTGWAGPATAWAGVLTALLLGSVALTQRDLKQLLAASTAAQLGFVVLAAGVGDVAGGAAHLVAHAATKAALFLAAGAWLGALGTKQLDALRGAARRWPLLGGAFTAAALTLAGVPPLSLWATKDDILAAAGQVSAGLYAVGLLAAALSAAYAGKALVLLWWPRPGVAGAYDTEQRGTRKVGAVPQSVVAVLAAAAVAAGLLLRPPAGPARSLLGVGGAGPGELLLSGAIAVAALVLVAAVLLGSSHRRRTRPAPGRPGLQWLGVHWLGVHWLGLGRATGAVVVRPVVLLARRLAAVDDGLGTAVDRWAGATVGVAGRIARVEGVLDASVRTVAAGVRRAGRGARRLQTGQIHRYYAQAVVALVALAVVALLIPR